MFAQNYIYGFCGVDVSTELYKNNDIRSRETLKYFGNKYEHVSFLKQIHSACCVEIASGADINYSNEADAQVTRNSKVILAIRTADCVPVLLVDAVHKVIGAAHAGWRGALGGVIDSAVKAMQHAGAQHRHIKAIIGPCIRQASYEVDEDFMSPFILKNVNNSKFFQPHPLNSNKKLFDLPSYVIEMLRVAGVQQVDDAGIDTLKNAKFFSYRRARAAGMKLPGHNVSFIALKI